MPRRIENVVRIRGPFGGLDLSRPARDLAPTDAVTASNVFTSHGCIETRPPLALIHQRSLSTPCTLSRPIFMKEFCVDVSGTRTPYLFESIPYNDGAAKLYWGTWNGSTHTAITTHTSTLPTIGGIAVANNKLYIMAANDITLARKYYYRTTYLTVTAITHLDAAGTGYTVGDLLTVSGGTGTAATIRVLAVDGGDGHIDSVQLEYGGYYSVTPGAHAIAMTGGSGANATISLTVSGSYASAWTAQNYGIFTPSVGVGTNFNATAAAGGTLTSGDTYTYRMCWYNATADVESPPTASAVHVIPSAGNLAVLCSWQDGSGTDAQITHVRIYRCHVGTDDTWYRLVELPVGFLQWTDYGYTVPPKTFDERLNTAAVAPPASTAICWHKGRMWYLPTAYPDEVWCSEMDKPEVISADSSFGISGASADKACALASMGGYLYILKTGSLFAISGDSLESFVCEQVWGGDGAGCDWVGSLLDVGETLYFSNADGVYALNQGAIRMISQKLGSTWPPYDTSALPKYAQFAYMQSHDLLIINSERDAKQFVYCPHSGAWTTWNVAFKSIANYRWLGSMYSPLVAGLTASGTDPVYESSLVRFSDWGTGNDYAGGTAAIAYDWKTGDLSLGIHRPKHFYYASLSWNKGAAADNVTFGTGVDQGTAMTTVNTAANSTRPMRVKDIGATGDTLCLEASGTASAKTQIVGFEIDAQPVGRR